MSPRILSSFNDTERLPPLPRASPRTWSGVIGMVISPLEPAASMRRPSRLIGRVTVPPGGGAREETVEADRQGQTAAGCDVAEEIVDADRQAERAAGSCVAEQTVQTERQGDTAAGGKVVEDCADVDRNVQGARV
jgi:hypothetical protein